MPKLKTKKGIKKRFKVSKNGKVKYRRAGKGHILTKKNRKRKRKLRTTGILEGADAKKIKEFLN